MTHTITLVKKGVAGDLRYGIYTVDITSYTASGESLLAGEFGMGSIVDFQVQSTENFYDAWYDYTNSLLNVYYPSTTHTHTVTIATGGTGGNDIVYLVGTNSLKSASTTVTGTITSAASTSAQGTEIAAAVDVGTLRVMVWGTA